MKQKMLRWLSGAAMSIAVFSMLGTVCRTWLYQPDLARNIELDVE